jgi:hypothetical protein
MHVAARRGSAPRRTQRAARSAQHGGSPCGYKAQPSVLPTVFTLQMLSVPILPARMAAFARSSAVEPGAMGDHAGSAVRLIAMSAKLNEPANAAFRRLICATTCASVTLYTLPAPPMTCQYVGTTYTVAAGVLRSPPRRTRRSSTRRCCAVSWGVLHLGLFLCVCVCVCVCACVRACVCVCV